jgi:large subunit ribosomal protein L7Ae
MPAKKNTTTTTAPAKGASTAPKTRTPKSPKDKSNPLFEKRPRNFGIGQAILPKRDLTRFVKWPAYIKLQRQRRILLNRLKVPPTLNQFTRTLDKSSATTLFKLLNKYKPESRVAKKQRLTKAAEGKAKGETVAATPRPLSVRSGINAVTSLVEQKKAKLVVIAHDVDPIELVVWLPTLCKKMNVPYAIVKGKSRLGQVIGMKTASALAITNVEKEDAKDLASLTDLFNASFNNNADLRKVWGGGKLGTKAAAAQRKREKAVAKENAAKMHV